MKVSLDTNILHQEGFNSQNMQILERLASAGMLELSIADLVLNEYETKRVSEVGSSFQSIASRCEEILKTLRKAGAESEPLKALLASLSSLESSVCQELKVSTERWLGRCFVKVMEQDPKIYKQLWHDYFNGNGAFKKAKNREDIPDAVIGLSLVDYAASENLTVVCKDGQLKGYLDKVENLDVYDGLDALIATRSIQDLLRALDARDSRIEDLKAAIGTELFKGKVFEYICKDESDLYYACWKDDEIMNHHMLPLPSYGGVVVNGPIVASIGGVSYGSVACVNTNHFVMPISFVSDVPVDFACGYGDWLQLSDTEKGAVELESMDGDGICDASVILQAQVYGQIVVVCLEEMSADGLLAHGNYIGSEGARLDVEFVPLKVVL